MSSITPAYLKAAFNFLDVFSVPEALNNLGLGPSGSPTFTNLTVTNTLTAATFITEQQLYIEDYKITLAYGNTGSGVPGGIAGVIVDRGTQTDAQLLWVEATQSWQMGLVGAMSPISTLTNFSATSPISYNNATGVFSIANNAIGATYLNYNTGNFKSDAGVLNTIQDINNLSTPTFNGIKLWDTSTNNTLSLVYAEDTVSNTTLNLILTGLSKTLTLVGNPTLGNWFDQSLKSTDSPQFVNASLISSTGSAQVTIQRNSNLSNGNVFLKTNTTQDFLVGLRGTSDSNFHIYSYGKSADVMQIDRVVGNVTFGPALSADVAFRTGVDLSTSSPNKTFFGLTHESTYTFNSGATSGNVSAFRPVNILTVNTGASVSQAITIEGTAPLKSGSGTVTNAYSGVFYAPSSGSTVNTALFADNLSVGYQTTTPPSNGAIIRGSVGIGTNSPVVGSNIHVSKASSGSLFVLSSTGGGANDETIQFRTSYSLAANTVIAEMAGVPSNDGGRFVFRTSQNGTGVMTERMRIDDFGSVGIGGIPTTKLDVFTSGTGVTCETRIFSGSNGSASTSNVSRITLATIGGGGGAVNNYIDGLFNSSINDYGIKVTPNNFFQVAGNLVLGSTISLGGASGVMFLNNRTTGPTGSPTAGGLLYAEGGAGKWRGSSGTTTTFGPAEPHCPVCGSDFGLEWENEKWGGTLQVCIRCLCEDIEKLLGKRPHIRRKNKNNIPVATF